MARYRKKPVVIEAVQFTCESILSSTPWLAAAREKPWGESGAVRIASDADAIEIATLEGVHRTMHGDWIIRGIKGELYPCKPEIFAATYEAVEVGVDGAGDR